MLCLYIIQSQRREDTAETKPVLPMTTILNFSLILLPLLSYLSHISRGYATFQLIPHVFSCSWRDQMQQHLKFQDLVCKKYYLKEQKMYRIFKFSVEKKCI